MRIAIVGAGPAGIAAARILIKYEVSIDVYDQYPQAGGQYWRHRKGESFPDTRFETLTNHSKISWFFDCSVWQIESEKDGYSIHAIKDGKQISNQYDSLLVASGAVERSLPVPGWTLPGVMTAGALQSLIKGQGVVPGNRIVIAGSGPFLFPVIETLQKTLRLSNSTKAEIVGIFEARRLSRWWRNSHGLILNPDKALEALRFLRYLRKNKLKVNSGRIISKVQESKTKTAKEIQITSFKREKLVKGAKDEYLECDLIAMSYGFTPDLTIPSILNLKTVNRFSDEIVLIDSNQRTSKLGIWAAGEITGIGGHELAIREGEIAAFDIVGKANSLASAIRKLDRWRKRIFADGLARIYKVGDRWFEWSAEDVIVCRCEEVSRDEILSSFTELGADSVRTSKLFTRAGMGMCQGRLCHRNVQDMARLFGSENTKTNRPIGGAVTLGELSD